MRTSSWQIPRAAAFFPLVWRLQFSKCQFSSFHIFYLSFHIFSWSFYTSIFGISWILLIISHDPTETIGCFRGQHTCARRRSSSAWSIPALTEWSIIIRRVLLLAGKCQQHIWPTEHCWVSDGSDASPYKSAETAFKKSPPPNKLLLAARSAVNAGALCFVKVRFELQKTYASCRTTCLSIISFSCLLVSTFMKAC